jgi:hypothetical protein
MSGDWEKIHEQLRQWVRAIEDRHPSPSAAILDSQSVETALTRPVGLGRVIFCS